MITAIVVGNELLLRSEMTASNLREIIRSVKARVSIPVTYADVWEIWLRNREVSHDVDFVTVHMLPPAGKTFRLAPKCGRASSMPSGSGWPLPFRPRKS